MEKQEGKTISNRDERRSLIKNVIVVGFAFLLNFSSFTGLYMLQSSLHRDKGMGVINSAIIFLAMMISSFFLPAILIAKLGHKWTMCVSFIGYILWMAANGYAIWGTMMTASIVLGVCAAPLWVTRSAYLTLIAKRYAALTNAAEAVVITRVFATFFFLYQFCGVTGSIVSSTILHKSGANISEDTLASCGVNDCPSSNRSNPNEEKPDKTVIWILVGVYIGIACSALTLVAFAVENIRPENVKEKEAESTARTLTSAFRHLKDRKQIALIPISFFIGLEMASFAAEFNKSYVSCAFGIWKVGLVDIPFALTGAVTAYGCGMLAPYVGRRVIVMATIVAGLAIQISLLVWMPKPEEEYVLYILASLWGFHDAVLQTQINALYGVTFPNSVEAGFANYEIWKSLGNATGLAYSFFICTSIKIYILMSVMVIGAIGCLLVEYWNNRSPVKLSKNGSQEEMKNMEAEVKFLTEDDIDEESDYKLS